MCSSSHFTSLSYATQHKKLYFEGTSKSVYVMSYDTKADFNSDELIIFLNSSFEFLVDGAYLDPSRKNDIAGLIKN